MFNPVKKNTYAINLFSPVGKEYRQKKNNGLNPS